MLQSFGWLDHLLAKINEFSVVTGGCGANRSCSKSSAARKSRNE
jgi:hypothetical protein